MSYIVLNFLLATFKHVKKYYITKHSLKYVLHSSKYTLFNTIYKSAVISACTQHKNKEIPYILSVLICFSLNVSLGTSHGSSAQQLHEARCTTLASTVLEESKANFISLE
jgi:hypothetical protein